MKAETRLSLVITSKSNDDPKLKQLLKSIEAQDFPKHLYETIIVTEGDSESAKAIGIRRSQGPVIGIFASDNEIVNPRFLSMAYNSIKPDQEYNCCFPIAYHYEKKDNALNRYFSLVGCNDPLALYMLKNDRKSVLGWFCKQGNFPTIGDNGFFIRKSLIMESDMEHYFHIDNVFDVRKKLKIALLPPWVWHKTGGNFLKFFAKRYKLGSQHAFNSHRRWHLVESWERWEAIKFILLSLTLIQPLVLSIKGYRKLKDKAWFLHLPVCIATVLTYGLLVTRQVVVRLFQLSSALLKGRS